MDKNKAGKDILGLYCFHMSTTFFLLPSLYKYIIIIHNNLPFHILYLSESVLIYQ